MWTAILVILGLVFIIFGILVGCASSDDDSEVGSVARATSAFLLIIGLILLIWLEKGKKTYPHFNINLDLTNRFKTHVYFHIL